MSKLTFWIINVTGVFLLFNRDPDNPSSTRLIMGWGLVAVGTIGILTLDWMRRRKKEHNGQGQSDIE